MSNYTRLPERGDIATYGADRKVRFVKYDASYDGIPTGQTAFGNVVERHGKDVLISNKVCASKKWAEKFLWAITGYTIDGSEHSFTLTANSVSITVTHSASTLEELATAINTAVAGGFGDQSYSSYVRDGVLILQHDSYTAYKAVTASGVTVKAYVGTENKAFTQTPKYNGNHSGEGAVINKDRALICYKDDLTSSSSNPSTDVTSLLISYPICKPAYLGTSAHQSDHCALLRATYGEGEAGWQKFMEDMMMVAPSLVGNCGDDSKLLTYRLAGQTYKDASDGTQKPLYPAFDYCVAVGYDAAGIEQGNWFMPNFNGVCALQRGITYPAKYEDGASVSVAAANADILTRSRNAIGATLLGNNSTVWSSCRYNASIAWYYSGHNGSAYNSRYFYNAYHAVPCMLYRLTEGE